MTSRIQRFILLECKSGLKLEPLGESEVLDTACV